MVQAAVKNWQRQQNLARQLRMMVVYANTAQRSDQSNYFPRLIDRFQPARLGDERRPMSRAVLGTPDPVLTQRATDLYFTYDIGVNYWIRPDAPASGLAAYRVSPWRKYGWEHRPSAALSWAMANQQ